MINLFSSDAQRVTIVRGPFKGTPLVPVSSYSWRKIFGIYEHVLNKWLESFVPHIEVVWDVGANDGYFCYGCAHRILEHRGQAVVVALEPGLEHDDCFLREASHFVDYRSADFHLVPKLVSNRCSDESTTLAQAFRQRSQLAAGASLIKVDVEDAEVDVLSGAGQLLEAPHQWVVEVHGDSLLQPVLQHFAVAGRKTEVIQPQPHWMMGREQRTIRTCWAVTV